MVVSQFFSSIECACLVSGVKHRGGNHQVAPSERGYFFGAQGFLLERMGFALSLRRTSVGCSGHRSWAFRSCQAAILDDRTYLQSTKRISAEREK
jgi:hypothetical protein